MQANRYQEAFSVLAEGQAFNNQAIALLKRIVAEDDSIRAAARALIAQAEPAQVATVATSLPALRAEWPGLPGSAYAGISTDKEGVPYALVKVATAPKAMNHAGQMAWAASLGADLLSRVESSLAFLTIPDELPKEWCWTNEEYGASSAWDCGFYNGGINCNYRSAEGGAVAVRRFPLQSFNPFVVWSAAAPVLA
jgi:hypothetical protein